MKSVGNQGATLGQTYYDQGRPQTAFLVGGYDLGKEIREKAAAFKKVTEPTQDEIKLNEKRLEELDALKKKVEEFQEVLGRLTNNLGVATETPNTFKKKMILALQNDFSVEIKADDYKLPDTSIPMNISVQQLATHDSFSGFPTIYQDPTEPLNSTGSITINGVNDFTIDITDGAGGSQNTTLEDIKNSINAMSKQVGATASILKIAENQYKLIITANETASPLSVVGSITPDEEAPINFEAIPATLEDLQAKFTFNNQAITRSTNEVTDLVDNITFKLLKPSENGGKVSAIIEPDREKLVEDIVLFTEKYNALNEFLNKNNQLGEDGKPRQDALLYGTSLIRSLKQTTLGMIAGSAIGIVEGDIKTFADVGLNIILGNSSKDLLLDGNLTIDNDKLADKISAHYEKIKKIFGAFGESSSPDFVARGIPSDLGNKIAGKEITVSYQKNEDNSYGASLSVEGEDPVSFLLEENLNLIIKGPKNSIFEGLKIAYRGNDPIAGGAPKTAIVKISQGIVDKLNHKINPFLQKSLHPTTKEELPNLFEVERERIITSNKIKQDHIDSINKRADKMVETLSGKVGKVLEQASKTENILKILDLIELYQRGK